MSERGIESYIQFKNEDDRKNIKNYFLNPKSMDSEIPTVVFSTPSETGTSYFRIFEPLRALYKKHSENLNIIYTENIQPNHLKIADCVVMHRCGNLHSHFLSVSRFWPKTEIRPLIIHDADDNEFNLPSTHPMKALWEKAGKDKMSIQSLKHSDLITTTTEKLAKTFKNFNNNVNIFRNQFDWELPQWNLDKEECRKEMLADWYPTDDKVIIGYAGLTSHFNDIKKVAPAIKEIHDKYPNTHFIIAGLALKDTNVEVVEENGVKKYREVAIEEESETYAYRVKSLFSEIDPNRIKFFKALPLEEYGKFYTLFDISLAYIDHNAFNSCKSEIKVVESLRYGCIPVFSYFGGYKEMWDNNEIPKEIKYNKLSISTTSPRIWAENIGYWVENIEEGKNIAAALKERTDYIYNINEHIDDYYYYLLEEIEKNREQQINTSAKYMDYF